MALTQKELKKFDANVGATSTIVASGIARLHLASPDPKKTKGKLDPDSILNQFPKLSKTDWTYADVVGGLVLVVDRAMDTMVFQIYNLDTNDIRFEYELYEDIKYSALNPRFHCFEMEDCVAGFDFSSDEVAQKFFSKVNALKPKGAESKKKKKAKKKKEKRPKKKTKGGKKNKFVVGEVMNVTHVGHIGNDGTGGFDLSQIPLELKKILKEAGIRKKDLKNAETAEAVVKAIQEQEMIQEYQAIEGYENYTENDIEKMFTEEHREEYQRYQEEMRKYEEELEGFRREQEQLEQWQRENAHLINEYTDGAPVAPPRRDLMKEQPPVAPPRVDRVTEVEVAPVAPPRVRQPVEPVQAQPPQQENSFDAEFRRKMEEQAKKPAVDIESKIQNRKQASQMAPKEEPKYNMEKLNALDPKLQVTETAKLHTNKITKNIYDRSAEEENTAFEPIVAKEAAAKSPDVVHYEEQMSKAQTAAERAKAEARKLQEERDRIMQTIKALEDKKKANQKDIKKQKKEELKLPPLPMKPKLPPPPKLPALPKLDIPLPPPPPPVPTFDMPPPIPAPAPAKAPAQPKPKPKSVKKAPKPAPVPQPVKKAPKPKPKPAPVQPPPPKKAPIIKPQTRKVSVTPEPTPPGTPVRPPGGMTPNDLMLGLMKGTQNLKATPKPAPKTVRPPPNLMLQELEAGRGKLRKTTNTPNPKKASINAGILKNFKAPVDNKGQGALMSKLAVTMLEIRKNMGEDSDSDSEESDWDLD